MSIPPLQRKLDPGFGRGVHYTEEKSMTIHVEIPDPLAAKVTEAARTQGTSPAEIVLDAVTRTLDPLADLRELMAPVYQRMEKLGITEDEAVEDFERIKHELRHERKTARS